MKMKKKNNENPADVYKSGLQYGALSPKDF